MLNVALLGAGRIGAVHANAIASHPHSQLSAISDFIPDNAQKLALEYHCDVRTNGEILTDDSIHAVLIATSTDTHSELMEAATAAGKAVLCEKPVDLDLERARTCRAAVQATGQPVMVGFNRRFDPNFQLMKTSLDAGDIGKPELLSITSFDPAPPPINYIKVSGGLFRDMMIHDFDMANFMMGEPPLSITASGSSLVDPNIGAAGDVDTAIVTLCYADGRLAVIKNSRRAVYGYDQRVELLGSDGLLQAQNVVENTVTKSTKLRVESAKPTYFFLERYTHSYANEWSAFVNALAGGGPLPVTLDDGILALAMAEAATRSLQTGQTVMLSDV